MDRDFRVVPFRRWHYNWLIDANPVPNGGGFIVVDRVIAQLEGQNSWTGVYEGNPVACAGTVQQWPGRHTAWAYLGKDTGPYMRWITRAVLANLAQVKGRVEMTVRADFPQGQRWARLLGFDVETPLLRRYGPQGEDHVGFARIN